MKIYADQLIGRTVFWRVNGYEGNEPYVGVCKIIDVNEDNRRPLITQGEWPDEVSGSLNQAFWDWQGVLCLSDEDRHVTIYDAFYPDIPLGDQIDIITEPAIIIKRGSLVDKNHQKTTL